MDERKYTVYMHTNKINNKAYIGITCQDVEDRWQNGLGYLKKNKYGEYTQPAFARAIEKYGWDNFEHIIVFKDVNKSDACKYEKQLILLFKTQNRNYGYNISSGGDDGCVGRIVSEETRARLSDAHKGKEGPNKGKSFSDEHKQNLCIAFEHSPNRGDEWRNKLSESHKGKRASDETKRRISEGHKGHQVSEETRVKIGNAHRGKAMSKESAEKMGKAHRKEAFVCIETGVVYDCAYTVEVELGIKNVKRACIPGSGRKTAGGLHWRLATEEEVLLCAS